MRTTVTIDPDTEIMLKEEVRRSGLSFKEVLNRSIRKGIGTPSSSGRRVEVKPLFPAPFPPEFQAGSLNRLADSMDDEATLRELGS